MANFVSKAARKSNEKSGRIHAGTAEKRAMDWSLYDSRGRRKYLVPKERVAFLQAAVQVGGKAATFCAVLAFSGARISEVLALTPERIDEADGTINFETLKRRRKGIIRAVPVPGNLFTYLDGVHHFRDSQCDPSEANKRLWAWSRTTAWRRVRQVMKLAKSPDHLSKPKSLRHAFGAEAALRQVPLTLIKKWMGHARLETTEIYTSLTGEDERMLAKLTWKGPSRHLRRRCADLPRPSGPR